MKIKLACLGLGALLAATAGAQAGDFSYGAGLRDRVDVPAPIPVPAPMPVPEGFTYYLRADLGWSFAGDPSFSESGATYGIAPTTFTYSGLPTHSVSATDLFIGTIGMGAYLTPHIRGDLTLDFRNQQDIDASATYLIPGAPAVNGLVTDNIKLDRVVGLVNLYWDILPRGVITPYIGAGVGFVYNDMSRIHLTTDDTAVPGPTLKAGSGKETNVGLAAALMAGASFSLDHKWVVDVNYRAMYLDGASVTATLTGTDGTSTSTARIDSIWEHQVRVGLRLNLW